MTLLTPAQLEAGAVVPQSVDNQFVTRDLFEEIRNDNLDYSSPSVKSRRLAVGREELIRSLIYAPQVVVNRAFLFSDLFSDLFSGDLEAGGAFEKLLAATGEDGIQAIVPFLYRERSLTDGVDFTRASAGEQALYALLDRLDSHPDCVRLHIDDAENATKTSDFGKRFADYFDTLQNFEPEVRFLLMEELIDDSDFRTRLHDSEDASYRLNFQRALRHLCQVARQYNDERAARAQDLEADATLGAPLPALSREHLYRELLMGSNTNKDAVPLGKFGADLDPAIQQYAFEIKKLVDLRYNTNLPDLIDRYSFSPMGFPTRSALHDQHMVGNQQQIDDLSDVLVDIRKLTENRLRSNFMDKYQRIQYSPFLASLDLSDVVAVRGTAEWRRFMQIQTDVLDDPIRNLANGLDDLHVAFGDLQGAVAAQYGSRAPAGESYEVFVTAAVSIGGTMVAYALDDFQWVDDVLLATSSLFLPERLKGVAVKLVYNVVDNTTGRISRRRSWQFEVARSEDVVSKAVAQSFFQDAARIGGRSTGRVSGLAEQEHR